MVDERRPGGLHDPAVGHDACGVGFLADLQGRPSREVLPLALTALARMAHRGAVDADGRTGDGAGVTTEIPLELLGADAGGTGGAPSARGGLAVGLVFLPRAEGPRRRARSVVEEALRRERLPLKGWREVPIREEVLGEKARRCRPEIAHVLVDRPSGLADEAFERALYRARRAAERGAESLGLRDLYVASLSHRTLVYKALVRATDLPDFYPDLRHPRFQTAFALFHQRFSTNTEPSWALTQPFRLLAHNGEINTIQGNRRWMEARGPTLASRAAGLGTGDFAPVLTQGLSDSASLDEALNVLTVAGRGIAHGMSLLVPPAWEEDREMAAPVRALFDYQSCLMEPWDGPALVAFTDGKVVGAALDRNGLRPARYVVTVDGLVLVASEAGVLDVADERVLHRGRLGPGDVVAVDLGSGRFVDRNSLHEQLAARRPYERWLAERRTFFEAPPAPPEEPDPGARAPQLRAFGYTREEMRLILGPMFRDGQEPLGSMGDDTPLAVLSTQPRLLFSYFKQRFAQVTNPPIDPLRESLVMSLAVHLGPQGNLLEETPDHAAQVHLPAPLLRTEELRALEALDRPGHSARRLGLLFDAQGGVPSFLSALEALLEAAVRAVEEGATLLILEDRGVDPGRAALPALLGVSAVHQHLVRKGLRLRASLVAETGEARDDHHVAALLGFGATAVCPYLALGAIADAVGAEGGSVQEAQTLYLATLRKGLLKILSKMGISTLRSYHGAQLFEAVGIANSVVDLHFTGTPSLVGGVGLDALAAEVLERHTRAYAAEADGLEEGSLHRYRQHGEPHAFEPRVVKALHAAIRTGDPLRYRAFTGLVNDRGPLVLRDLLEFKAAPPLPLETIEPVEALFPRFMTAAMSLGALSPEAHEALAVAAGLIGVRSNSGEGGEDGTGHAIKQVASGRFGVTAAYLMAANELQIKMAQGSKPGEGGQLPGHKVSPYIARVRHASPGIALISPPPHHDIYSIEDLAQLIYDLKRVNPRVRVGVKLVSEAGVGTVAVGVAKAHADAILIGGHDGGTGASPLGSIKNAGTPWELGLAEAHQALVASGLRPRVRLQVEGGLRTGRDVVVAAMLGADEYGFGSLTLLSFGCVMARQCHLNTCPVGIATQREDLRGRFRGTPEDVIRLFRALGEEVREILASVGHRSLQDVIGRTGALEVRGLAAGKAATLRLDRMLAGTGPGSGPHPAGGSRNDPPETGGRLDEAVLARLRGRAPRRSPLAMGFAITNADRAVGARIAGALVSLKERSSAPVALNLTYRGSAGQSFGAFCVDGMRLRLEGEANDYVGKGMSGGEIAIRPHRGSARRDPVLAGNTLLYGATGGRLFLAGSAGERFAVRNSGALAMVEGVGDHACEYMTAGAVVILGPTGRNVGAGMTGGVAYAFDPEGTLARRCNLEMIALADGLSKVEEAWLREGLERHWRATESPRARGMLNGWTEIVVHFRRVSPKGLPDARRLTPWALPRPPAAIAAVALTAPPLRRREPALAGTRG